MIKLFFMKQCTFLRTNITFIHKNISSSLQVVNILLKLYQNVHTWYPPTRFRFLFPKRCAFPQKNFLSRKIYVATAMLETYLGQTTLLFCVHRRGRAFILTYFGQNIFLLRGGHTKAFYLLFISVNIGRYTKSTKNDSLIATAETCSSPWNYF